MKKLMFMRNNKKQNRIARRINKTHKMNRATMKKTAEFTQDELDNYAEEIEELTAEERDLFYRFEDRAEDVEECLEYVNTYSMFDDFQKEVADFVLSETDTTGYELEDYVDTISRFSEPEYELFQVLVSDEGYNFDNAISLIEDGNYRMYDAMNPKELAEMWIDDFGSLEEAVGKNTIPYYFDYESYGEDLIREGNFLELNGSYIEIYE